MNSLRSRLVLGSALIAVVPLALAIYLLSQRVETMVRAQAGERLSAALGGLQAELETQGGEVQGKLRILARDANLKRSFLVGAEDGALSEYLNERRFLLGLDFLRVADAGGTVVAAAGVPIHSGMVVGARGPVLDSLAGVAGLALAATVPILYQGETAGALHGGLMLDGVFLARLERRLGVDLVLRDGAGRAVASTFDGAAAAPQSPDLARVRLVGDSYLSRGFPLALGSGPKAEVTGLVSAAAADRTVAGLQLASLLLGALGVALAIGMGAVWSSQISGPVERLAAFSERLSHGDWEQPVKLESVRELQTLVAALERMRGELRTYRDQLVIGERHAAWSQMARQVAHEIKNPLTPIAVSVADLKRSFDQQRPDFPQILDQAVRVVGEEVQALKRLLDEFAELGRFSAPQLARCDVVALIADLEALYARDVAAGRLEFSRAGPPLFVHGDAAQLRQVLVNLIQNGLEAAGEGRVEVTAAPADGAIEVAVSNSGPPLTAEQRAHLFVPGFTTKAKGSGLGLTIAERIVNDHRGTIGVDSRSEHGTTFRVRLPSEPRS